MKYFLVQSSIDYGDEFDVNSLNCLTEQEYLDLLDKPLGEKNEYYQDDLLIWKIYEKDHAEYIKLYKERLWNKHYIDYTKEDYEWITLNSPKEPEFPKRYNDIYIVAKLGSQSEEFEEIFNNYDNILDLIDTGLVKVHVVNEDFYNLFHKADLKKLSLTNIFE
jgi:hypothetical protein